jgi:hypothetical protein
MFTDCIVIYSGTPLTGIDWYGEISGYAENPDNFFLIGYIGSLNFGCYCLHYVPASKPFNHA